MTAEKADAGSAVESEVAYLRLGELHVACIPGELYPELVYGKFQEPVGARRRLSRRAAGADDRGAHARPEVAADRPGQRRAGLHHSQAAVGHGSRPMPMAKDGGQYGEINSCGPEVAPILMEALKRRIDEAKQATQVQAAGKE